MPYKVGAIATYGANMQPTGREDKEALPFKNLQVRQAMNLAIDKQAILKDYYQGHGDLLGWPYYNTPEYKDLYTPLDQLPANVQELVKGGNVDKAKQLLTDAGYPNGFKTNIYASNAVDADFLSIIKEQLLKANIELDIRTVEAGTFRTMEQTRSWPEMWYKASKQYFLAHYMFELRPESQDSAAFWDSQQTRDVLASIAKNLAVDDKAWRKALKDVTPFMLEQSISIWLPISEKYIVWQPWVKNFHGEVSLGAFLPLHFLYYTYIDSDLKKSMGD